MEIQSTPRTCVSTKFQGDATVDPVGAGLDSVLVLVPLGFVPEPPPPLPLPPSLSSLSPPELVSPLLVSLQYVRRACSLCRETRIGLKTVRRSRASDLVCREAALCMRDNKDADATEDVTRSTRHSGSEWKCMASSGH